MGIGNARRARPAALNWFCRSVSDRLPQRRTGPVEEALHPTTPPSRIVIFANWLALLRLYSDCPHAALVDLYVAALITRLQFPVEAEFHAQTLAAHSRLYRGALDLIATAGETERIVVADHALFRVTENGGQIQLRRQRPMLVGEVCHGPGEMRIPLRPILFLQKRIRTVAAFAFTLVVVWIGHRALMTKPFATSTTTGNGVAATAERTIDQLTIHDLFLTDFHGKWDRSPGAIFITDKEPRIRVEYAILTNATDRSKFLEYYVSEKTADLTFGACAYLAKQAKFLFDNAMQMQITSKAVGDSAEISTNDLPFSGRVFVYHEAYLPPERSVDLTKIYAKHGEFLVLRSIDYLTNKKLEEKVKALRDAK